MQIKSIKKIKNTGVLQNLSDSNLASPDLDFKKINLIFGWNGTGKTTLSRILRSFELGRKCDRLEKYTNSEIDIRLDSGDALTQADFSPKQNIRVFNKDFVLENIFKDEEVDGDNVKPIYYLGSDKIELTKERKERDDKNQKLVELRSEFTDSEKAKEKFEKDSAKSIKDTLLGIQKFQHYFKDKFIKSFDELKELLANGKKLDDFTLSEEDFESKLRTVKNYEALNEWLNEIKRTAGTLTESYLENLNDNLLGKTVSMSKTIERLKADWQLSNWVQEGLSIHKERELTKCEFCQQELPVGRIEDLEQHFNKDYTGLVESVKAKIKELQEFKIGNASKIPNAEAKRLANQLNTYLDQLIKKVQTKQIDILENHSIKEDELKELAGGFLTIKESTEHLIEEVAGVADTLEQSLVAEHYDSYNAILNRIKEVTDKGAELKEEVARLDQQIKEGEKSIQDFNLPAEEINSDLEKFLGHSELKFSSKTDEYNEVYYVINRNEEVAFNLSEGEKTAISLIYFLKKLKEDGFEAASGIVFIDDPISSMDSQFLYSAYAYIVASIEQDRGTDLKIDQFILSTHNFDFFTLFKKKYWQAKYVNQPDRRRCEMYMLRINPESDMGRCSNLYMLDELLRDYDSDYHYLYSLLLDFEGSDDSQKEKLKTVYPYPNIARRVLETFLSFKYPSRQDLQGKFNSISHPDITKEVKESVYRFINIKSHGTLKEAEGFAPEVVDPSAKNQILNVLNIMRVLDPDHCTGMEG